MSGLYGGSGGGSHGGGIYGGGASAPSHEHHHGLLHALGAPARFAGHLLADVRDAAVGLPMGVVSLTRHPVRSIEAMGKTTWHDWSPLFHGHLGEFAHNVYDHPLAPILDVAAVFTGGATGAARAAAALERGGLAAEGGRVARLAQAGRVEHEVVKVKGAPEAYRHYEGNPAAKMRQKAQVKLGQHLAEHMPKWFGREAHVTEDGSVEVAKGRVRDLTDHGYAERYFQKQESYRAGAHRAAIHAQVAAFVKAGEDLSKRPGEVAVQIERHGHEQLMRHAYTVAHTDAKQLKKGFSFVKARPDAMGPVHSLEDFKSQMERFGNRHTTSNIEEAARDANGHYLIVHKRGVINFGKEGARSATFLGKLYKYPTKAWKYAVLATRPAYFVNNAVGNTFMALASLGPVGFVRGLTDAFRQVHGEAATEKSLEGAMRKLKGDWQDQEFLGVHQGFGQEAMGTLHLHERVDGHPRTARVLKIAEQGFYPVTHKVADVFLRRVMINAIMRRHSKVRSLMKDGESFDKAAAHVSRDPAVRDFVQEQVNNALGDYHHLTPVEQHVRQFVPFYTWDRAIMRHGVHLALNKPGTAAQMAMVGEHGTKETEKLLGDIPDFMKGLLVLGGHGKDGRSRVLSTQGLNPYASIPDVLDTAGAAIGVGKGRPGEAIAMQVNPLISGAIESTTGQSLLSGAKLPHRHGGIIGRTASNVVEGLPQARLIETLLGGEPQPKVNQRTGKAKPFLYRKNARAQIAALLGVPVKELNQETAHELARKESGRKKGRSKKHSLYGG